LRCGKALENVGFSCFGRANLVGTFKTYELV
jgi:hypothetical protein